MSSPDCADPEAGGAPLANDADVIEDDAGDGDLEALKAHPLMLSMLSFLESEIRPEVGWFPSALPLFPHVRTCGL